MGDNYEDDFEEDTHAHPVPPSGKPDGASQRSLGFAALSAAAHNVDEKDKEEVAAVMAKTGEEMNKDYLEQSKEGNENDTDDDDDDELDGDDYAKALNTTLRVACNKGDLTEVRKMIDKSASLYSKDTDGWMAIHWAAKNGNAQIIRELVTAAQKGGSDARKYVNKREFSSGWTPLQIAAFRCNRDAVNVLILFGANLKRKNAWGEIAAEMVPQKGDHRIAVLELLGVTKEKEETKFNERDNESKMEGAEEHKHERSYVDDNN